MINGAHVIIYSRDAEADRAFLRDVLGCPHADAGGGWLIFKLPPAEVAVHPIGEGESHELYLMCDDVEATVTELAAKGVEFVKPVSNQGWGLSTSIRLPGGGASGFTNPGTNSPTTSEPARSVNGLQNSRTAGCIPPCWPCWCPTRPVAVDRDMIAAH
ncbi:MAG: VOC family protein [Pseudonocardiaceae bacterium]